MKFTTLSIAFASLFLAAGCVDSDGVHRGTTDDEFLKQVETLGCRFSEESPPNFDYGSTGPSVGSDIHRAWTLNYISRYLENGVFRKETVTGGRSEIVMTIRGCA